MLIVVCGGYTQVKDKHSHWLECVFIGILFYYGILIRKKLNRICLLEAILYDPFEEENILKYGSLSNQDNYFQQCIKVSL